MTATVDYLLTNPPHKQVRKYGALMLEVQVVCATPKEIETGSLYGADCLKEYLSWDRSMLDGEWEKGRIQELGNTR